MSVWNFEFLILNNSALCNGIDTVSKAYYSLLYYYSHIYIHEVLRKFLYFWIFGELFDRNDKTEVRFAQISHRWFESLHSRVKHFTWILCEKLFLNRQAYLIVNLGAFYEQHGLFWISKFLCRMGLIKMECRTSTWLGDFELFVKGHTEITLTRCWIFWPSSLLTSVQYFANVLILTCTLYEYTNQWDNSKKIV